TATARNLDPVGRVVDFSVLKDLFNNWLNANWDHGFLYYTLDRELSRAFQREELITMKTFRCPFNPTAEEMAKHLLDLGPEILSGTEVQLARVKIFETPNCWAEATNEVISRGVCESPRPSETWSCLAPTQPDWSPNPL